MRTVRNVRNIFRRHVIESFKSEKKNFVSYTLSNRQPVKLFENRRNMIIFSGSCNKAESCILHTLQLTDQLFWQAKEQKIKMINFGSNESMNASFRIVL